MTHLLFGTTAIGRAVVLMALAAPGQALAQPPAVAADAIPLPDSFAAVRAALTAPDSSGKGRFLLAVGAAFGHYSALNRVLTGSRYPSLPNQPAYALGVGVQADINARFWVGADVRMTTPRVGRADYGAYTRLLTTALGVVAGWQAVHKPRVSLDFFAGPEVQLVALTLRGPDTAAAASTSFAAYVAAPPDKRTLFQQHLTATAGLQLDFRPKPRPRVAAPRRRQLGLGLRLQLSEPVLRGRWHGTDTRDVPDVRLGRAPVVRPLRAAATLVITNLFGALGS